MKTFVLAVRDSAVGAYGRPVFVPSVAVGVRSFRDEVNRNSPDNSMFAHAEDYELYLVAEWNEDEAVFTMVPRELIARGKDVKE